MVKGDTCWSFKVLKKSLALKVVGTKEKGKSECTLWRNSSVQWSVLMWNEDGIQQD